MMNYILYIIVHVYESTVMFINIKSKLDFVLPGPLNIFKPLLTQYEMNNTRMPNYK